MLCYVGRDRERSIVNMRSLAAERATSGRQMADAGNKGIAPGGLLS